MARNIFVVLEELRVGLEELTRALAPLNALAGSATQAPRPTAPKKATRPARTPASVAMPAAAKATTPRPANAKGKATGRPRTPGQLLHIQYMNALKQLGVGHQARVKKVRKAEGAEAALKLAASLAK